MAQRISDMPPGSMPYAREALPYASLQRGTGAMNPPNAGLRNMDDSGAYTKPYMNAQGERNTNLAIQNVEQNGISAVPQAQSAAMGQVRTAFTEESSQVSKAQQFMNMNLANQMEANDIGAATMKLNAVMQSPDREQFMNDVAVSKAMGEAKAPELGQMTAEANRYYG